MSNHKDHAKLYMAVRLKSEANLRGHWIGGYARGKLQKDSVLFEWLRIGRPVVAPPCEVTITRIAPRKLDCDNLQRSAKAIRDAIAERVLDADDGDERITWRYAQEKGHAKTYACRVEVIKTCQES